MIKILADIGIGLMDLIFNTFQNLPLDNLYSAYEKMMNILSVVCYFLPMNTISAIFSITVAIFTTKIVIMCLRTVWDVLPIL